MVSEVIHGLALCAGVGGLELGLRLVLGPQYRVVCWVERDKEAVAVLSKQMEAGILFPAPVWDDLTTFAPESLCGLVDILAAGWPCQTHSTAARGRYVEVDLWPSVFQAVAESQPTIVFLENVPAVPWEMVGADLASLGYTVPSPILVEAADVGAPHRRPRVFLLAYTDEAKQLALTLDDEVASPSRTTGDVQEPWMEPPYSTQLEHLADGISSGMVHALAGNAVIPLVAAAAFTTLARRAGLMT